MTLRHGAEKVVERYFMLGDQDFFNIVEEQDQNLSLKLKPGST